MSKILDLTTGYNDLVDQANQVDVVICEVLTERLLRFLRTVKDDPGITSTDVRAAIECLGDARPPSVSDWCSIHDGALLATVRYGYSDGFQMALDPRILRDDVDAAFAEIAAEVALRIEAAQVKAQTRAKYYEQARQARERQQLADLLTKYDLVAVPAPKEAA